MKNTRLAILAALTLSVPATSWAQDEAAPRGERPGRPGMLFNLLDANQDGVVDQREIERISQAISRLDRNNDGVISRDEIPAQGPMPPPAFGPRGGRGPDFAPGPGGQFRRGPQGDPGAAPDERRRGPGPRAQRDFSGRPDRPGPDRNDDRPRMRDERRARPDDRGPSEHRFGPPHGIERGDGPGPRHFGPPHQGPRFQPDAGAPRPPMRPQGEFRRPQGPPPSARPNDDRGDSERPMRRRIHQPEQPPRPEAPQPAPEKE